MRPIQHVYRRGRTFWWRRVLCFYEDSRCDIRLSLRTADRHRARELGAALTAASGGVRMLVEEMAARRPDERPSEAELQAIAKAEFQNQLARYCDQQREHPRHRAMHSAANLAYADYYQRMIDTGGRPVFVTGEEAELLAAGYPLERLERLKVVIEQHHSGGQPAIKPGTCAFHLRRLGFEPNRFLDAIVERALYPAYRDACLEAEVALGSPRPAFAAAPETAPRPAPREIAAVARRGSEAEAARAAGDPLATPADPLSHYEIKLELERIAKKSVIVANSQGRIFLDQVRGMTAHEAVFLQHNQQSAGIIFHKRFEFQELEIGRLRAYRTKHPEAWTALLKGEGHLHGVPKAVAALFARYREHPDVGGEAETIERNVAQAPQEADRTAGAHPSGASRDPKGMETATAQRNDSVRSRETGDDGRGSRAARVLQDDSLQPSVSHSARSGSGIDDVAPLMAAHGGTRRIIPSGARARATVAPATTGFVRRTVIREVPLPLHRRPSPCRRPAAPRKESGQRSLHGCAP